MVRRHVAVMAAVIEAMLPAGAAQDGTPSLVRMDPAAASGPLREVVARAAEIIDRQYPAVQRILFPGAPAPTSVVVLAEGPMPGVPATTSGNRITLGREWFGGAHSNDMGCVVHELTHVVQAYPPGGPGWLVEGIADYVRFGHFEPDPRALPASGRGRSYRESYRTVAAFLIHVELSGHTGTVRRLNEALRRRAYSEGLWMEITGRPLDALWRDFEAADFRALFSAALREKRWPPAMDR